MKKKKEKEKEKMERKYHQRKRLFWRNTIGVEEANQTAKQQTTALKAKQQQPRTERSAKALRRRGNNKRDEPRCTNRQQAAMHAARWRGGFGGARRGEVEAEAKRRGRRGAVRFVSSLRKCLITLKIKDTNGCDKAAVLVLRVRSICAHAGLPLRMCSHLPSRGYLSPPADVEAFGGRDDGERSFSLTIRQIMKCHLVILHSQLVRELRRCRA
ncbi:hypothetical protein QOT17_023869 [Balamuthia mandrillaris]